MHYGFEVLKLDRILAGVDLPNKRSQRLVLRLASCLQGKRPKVLSTKSGSSWPTDGRLG